MRACIQNTLLLCVMVETLLIFLRLPRVLKQGRVFVPVLFYIFLPAVALLSIRHAITPGGFAGCELDKYMMEEHPNYSDK